jgi:hypothetical protein
MARSRDEIMRRLRLGDIRKLLHYRYGPTLPDDDAGREDLIELLKPVSLGIEADKRMRNQIDLWAPWATDAEAIIDHVARLPIWYRKSKAEAIGQRFRLTNAERERYRLWTMAPVDMTAEDLAEQRKAKHRARQKRYRTGKRKQTRPNYLAKSLTKNQPWLALGISRRTWYRRRDTLGTSMVTPAQAHLAQVGCEAKVDRLITLPVPHEQASPPQGLQREPGLNGHATRPAQTPGKDPATTGLRAMRSRLVPRK